MRKSFEINVIVGEICNNKIINQKAFNGKPDKVVDFMNTEFAKRFLKLKDEDKIVFNINPETEEDMLDNWFTLQQLVDSDIIYLEE